MSWTGDLQSTCIVSHPLHECIVISMKNGAHFKTIKSKLTCVFSFRCTKLNCLNLNSSFEEYEWRGRKFYKIFIHFEFISYTANVTLHSLLPQHNGYDAITLIVFILCNATIRFKWMWWFGCFSVPIFHFIQFTHQMHSIVKLWNASQRPIEINAKCTLHKVILSHSSHGTTMWESIII